MGDGRCAASGWRVFGGMRISALFTLAPRWSVPRGQLLAKRRRSWHSARFATSLRFASYGLPHRNTFLTTGDSTDEPNEVQHRVEMGIEKSRVRWRVFFFMAACVLADQLPSQAGAQAGHGRS
jgi:hypothetical protein